MGLLNPGGPIAQFKRNRCSISPVELILQSGVRSKVMGLDQAGACEYLRALFPELPQADAERLIRYY